MTKLNIDELPPGIADELRKKNHLISKKYEVLGRVWLCIAQLSKRDALWVLRTVVRQLIQRKNPERINGKNNHRG